MTYYVHHVPGRLRVKIPEVKGLPAKGRRIQSFLEGLTGVDRVEVNPLTGSVVAVYDAEVFEAGDILKALKEQGYLEETGAIKAATSDPFPLSRAGAAVGKAIFGWAVGRALEGTGLSFLAVLI